MKTLQNINIKDKIVLVRVDYNVPIKDQKVTSDLRIRASLPTIEYLLKNGAKRIILISHLGRPDGAPHPDFSLSPVAAHLQQLLPNVKTGFYALPTPKRSDLHIPAETKVALLENLRFNPGEEQNDPTFIKSIIAATGAEVYIQDAFAVLHRAHASTDAVKEFLPLFAGLLVEKEVKNLQKAIESPTHPILLIIGGAKVSDKEPLIEKFLPLADHILVGGKIAADGYAPATPKIYVAEDFDEDAQNTKLDIGPVSTAKFAEKIASASTIIWNGVLGKTEDPAYATASTIVATLISDRTKAGATTIICGGDTTGFVESLIATHPDLEYSLISTGGGAALEFLLGRPLPGLQHLQ